MEFLGSSVQFGTDPDDVQTSALALEPAFWLLHAPDTPGLRACDLYMVKPTTAELGASRALKDTYVDEATLASLQRATDFHVKSSTFVQTPIEIPRSGWQRIDQVWFLRYWVPGEQRGRTHRYGEPVWLYGVPGRPAYRIAMPDGCIVDSRGIVHP